MTIREANPSDRERLVEMALAFLTTTPYGTLMPSNADLLERFVDVVFGSAPSSWPSVATATSSA